MSEFSKKAEYEKTHFNINIAEIETEINTVYPSSYFFCQEYLSNGTPLIKIEVTKEDIQLEVEKEEKKYFFTCTEFSGRQNNQIKTKEINESKIELPIVYRKIVEAVLDYNIIFMHGAVIAVQNQAFMFSAPSGTGKTTHIMKWLQNRRDSIVVNGDKPLIKITDSNVTAYGTPWCGKEGMGTNTKSQLKAIVLMERSEENHIDEITFGQAYPFLLQQTYMPQNPEKAKKTLSLLAKLYNQVRIYRFRFNNFADDCFDVAYQGLLGKKE